MTVWEQLSNSYSAALFGNPRNLKVEKGKIKEQKP
jgi:hypothetical protein